MIKAVFWDLGGTICRTDGGGKLLGAVRMAQTLKPYCGNFYKSLQKVTEIMKIYQIRRNAAEKEPRMDDLLHEVFQFNDGLHREITNAIHLGVLKYTTPLPGIREALDLPKQLNLPMALVTDGFYGQKFVNSVLEKLHIKDRFEKIIISCEIGFGKPHPEIFLSACKEMKVKPNEVLFIGDREERDIIGATGVGMKTVLVGKAPKKTNPDLHIKNLSQLKYNFTTLIKQSG